MARGRKPKVNLTIDEQIALVETRIMECQKDLTALKVKKKELINDREKEELDSLYSAIKAKGITVAEVVEKLKD